MVSGYDTKKIIEIGQHLTVTVKIKVAQFFWLSVHAIT